MSTPALVSKAPLRQVATTRELLSNQQARDQLAAVAAEHMSPERMMRLLALAIDKTPMIAECTPLSILGCLMTCASLGLEPSTSLHHAYIIPRKNTKKGVVEATLQIGYRGYIQLGHNSGQIAGIDAGVHYSDDEHWLFRKGAHGVLEHVPGPEQGEKLHAYAVVNLVNGNAIWAVWPWAKVLAHRDRYSDGYKTAIKYGRTDNPWQTNEDAMAMKTMIRQLAKWMPMSSEIVRAAAIDGQRANYAGFAMDPTMGIPAPDVVEDANEADAPAIEATTVEPQDEPATEEEQAPPAPKRADPKAAATAAAEKARAAAGKPAVAAAPKDEDVAEASAWEVVAGQIRGEIDAAAPADVPDILDLWSDKLDPMKREAPELFSEIQIHAARRENSGNEG